MLLLIALGLIVVMEVDKFIASLSKKK